MHCPLIRSDTLCWPFDLFYTTSGNLDMLLVMKVLLHICQNHRCHIAGWTIKKNGGSHIRRKARVSLLVCGCCRIRSGPGVLPRPLVRNTFLSLVRWWPPWERPTTSDASRAAGAARRSRPARRWPTPGRRCSARNVFKYPSKTPLLRPARRPTVRTVSLSDCDASEAITSDLDYV